MKRLKNAVGSLTTSVRGANTPGKAMAVKIARTNTEFSLLSRLNFGPVRYNTLQSIDVVADQTKKLGSYK